jgi:hypothetical protein
MAFCLIEENKKVPRMARRQNTKLIKSSKQNNNQSYKLPPQIDVPIRGIEPDGLDFINLLLKAYNFGLKAFDTTTPHHEDWVMLFVILANDATGRATVTKNIVELTGRAYGTVRSSLQRFEELGFIEPNQRIGRSELYVPTPLLKTQINQYAQEFWRDIEALRKGKPKGR